MKWPLVLVCSMLAICVIIAARKAIMSASASASRASHTVSGPGAELIVVMAARSERAAKRAALNLFDTACAPFSVTLCICFYDHAAFSEEFIQKWSAKRPDAGRWLNTHVRYMVNTTHSATCALAEACARMIHPTDTAPTCLLVNCTPVFERNWDDWARALNPNCVYTGTLQAANPKHNMCGTYSFASGSAYNIRGGTLAHIQHAPLERTPRRACPNLFFSCSLAVYNTRLLTRDDLRWPRGLSDAACSFVVGISLCAAGVPTCCFPTLALRQSEPAIESRSDAQRQEETRFLCAWLDSVSGDVLAKFERMTGLRLSSGSCVGRARLGVSADADGDEIVSKFGTRAEFEAQKQLVLGSTT